MTKTATHVPAVNDGDMPTPSQIQRHASLVPARAGTIAGVTTGQAQLGKYLVELERWLDLQFVSPRAIATATQLAIDTDGDPFFFTLLAHTETQFDREIEGSVTTDEVHLWLAKAQSDLRYRNNAQELVEVPAGTEFIVSQKRGKIRDRIAEKVVELLEVEGAIPNVTMRFAKVSAKAKALGYSPAVTFATADYADTI